MGGGEVRSVRGRVPGTPEVTLKVEELILEPRPVCLLICCLRETDHTCSLQLPSDHES